MIKRFIFIFTAGFFAAAPGLAFTAATPQYPVTRSVTPAGNVSRPQTAGVVTRPVTSSAVQRPISRAGVNQPVTSSSVAHPVSRAVVTHPVTGSAAVRPVTSSVVTHPVGPAEVNRPGSPGNMQLLGTSSPGKISSAQTTMSDYKPTRPKALGGANAGAAAKLGGGEAGLGASQNKDAEASASDLKQFSQKQVEADAAAKAEERVGVLNSFINAQKNETLRKEKKK